jgi:hypothetical protein
MVIHAKRAGSSLAKVKSYHSAGLVSGVGSSRNRRFVKMRTGYKGNICTCCDCDIPGAGATPGCELFCKNNCIGQPYPPDC